jgi:hypothetical protein
MITCLLVDRLVVEVKRVLFVNGKIVGVMTVENKIIKKEDIVEINYSIKKKEKNESK